MHCPQAATKARREAIASSFLALGLVLGEASSTVARTQSLTHAGWNMTCSQVKRSVRKPAVTNVV